MGQGRLRATRALALIAATAALAVPAALAGDSADTAGLLGISPDNGSGAMVNESPNMYFVEFSGTKAAFTAEAKAGGVKYTERYSYGKLFNGISVKADSAQRAKLGALGSVKAVWPVHEVKLAPTSVPDLATAVAQTGADLANTAGWTGAGVKVAIMDTGVDYNHPDLGGDGVDSDAASNDGVFDNDFPGSRVITGWDFVGNAYDASEFTSTGAPNPNYSPVPVPDPDPDDCNSHGTHVSGIVGASPATATGVKGVAPGVQFGAYRVFGCGGSTTDDVMLAAMERALADGMDVLNMSIGDAFNNWPQSPTARGASALVDAGMVVVASIGNSGADGLYSAGAPGVGDKVIGVASFDNTHVRQVVFRVSPDGRGFPFGNAAGAPAAPTSGSLPMAKTGTPTTADDGCAAAPAGTYAGNAVLIRRGTCPFHTKALNAMNAGAAAVVLYNNVAGALSPTVAGTPAITIPVVAITAADGAEINNRIASGPTTLTWTNEQGTFVNPTGGLISSFSSYGMTADLQLKPDIGAPGGLIRSTYPLELGSYATISGTSMSSPHVAGAAALLKQARPTLAASDFRAILQNSADPKNWSGSPGLGLLDFAHRQGAGMVDIDDAIASTTTVTPGKLSFGEGTGGAGELSIANASSTAQTYALSHVAAVASGPNPPAISPFAFGVFLGAQTATFSSPSVTVPAGGTGSVGVSIAVNPAALPNQAQYGGYVVLTRQSDGQVFRVPYAGLLGDYQSIVAMPTRGNFPALGKEVAINSFALAAPTEVWTLENMSEVPNVLLHFDHQVRRLEIEVVDAASGARLHPVFSNVYEQDYLSRNQTATGFFAYPWEGGRLHSNGNGSKSGLAWKTVPDGTYKLNVRALKALGDSSNAAHWETWTSPAVTIDRP
jgi:minor extracellular serine protease Vpr